ncbi:DUF2690 domain-containing protein [Streptomyces exfoliatus]|uniref:DUF2690 domain-containing protein n=1 Tax=Streptomyces exfoliatus TaxID=1905 RepID=A0ABV3CPW4_STREX
MPGWKALPDELDPDVGAFTERLRRLIDRSGLAVTAVAERTGHERSAWDAYLNGRLPVPRSAVVALAEVAGSDPAALATDWELAERAWSRGRGGDAERDVARDGARDAEPGRGRDAEPDAGDRTMQIRRLDRPEPAGTSAGASPAPRPRTADSHAPAPTPAPTPASSSGSRRQSVLLSVAGVLGALLVVTAALLLVDLGGSDGGGGDGGDGGDGRAVAPPTTSAPPATPRADLPAGVMCAGSDCTGRDPEEMGCGGPLATTVARTRVGAAQVEVRYSDTCAAAWARITGAAPGDAVTVEVAGAVRRAAVTPGSGAEPDTDAYTPMVAVGSGADARACATLANGGGGCTTD